MDDRLFRLVEWIGYGARRGPSVNPLVGAMDGPLFTPTNHPTHLGSSPGKWAWRWFSIPWGDRPSASASGWPVTGDAWRSWHMSCWKRASLIPATSTQINNLMQRLRYDLRGDLEELADLAVREELKLHLDKASPLAEATEAHRYLE